MQCQSHQAPHLSHKDDLLSRARRLFSRISILSHSLSRVRALETQKEEDFVIVSRLLGTTGLLFHIALVRVCNRITLSRPAREREVQCSMRIVGQQWCAIVPIHAVYERYIRGPVSLSLSLCMCMYDGLGVVQYCRWVQPLSCAVWLMRLFLGRKWRNR